MEFKHKPVLLDECIQGLNIKKDGIYVDGTLGGAGHSKVIADNLSNKGLLIGIDRDEEALNAAKERLKDYNNVIYVHGNHDDIMGILESLNISKVDGILLDLGVSSYQLDEKTRGFSYIGSNDLDMRMDKAQKLTAKEIVNTYSEEKLAEIIFEYGEERYSRNIARNICIEREKKAINTTADLVNIIEKSIPKSKQKDGHPAKRTFQAIRIEVNDELKPLYDTIMNSIKALNDGGRLCVITFHSLEDRAVKQAFIDAEGRCTCPKELPYCICNNKSYGRIINKKPIVSTEEELKLNSRAQSAKLRIFERKEVRTYGE
ncbi:MAG: 16S rRNA (cytosine(1402)-N(4))-methyltransferase RsmH [Clostridia bacterium]|nr:16S rRNA (cytosine(1402)-N(4))-methyltransferase RsmH [Clostridia bacterium]